MIRKTLAVLGLLLWAGLAAGADREVKGKLIEVDTDEKVIIIVNDAGKKVEYTFGAASKVHDSKGISNFGFKDARLKPGATVKVVLPDKGSNLKELHIVASGSAAPGKAPPKPEPMGSAARRTAPGKDSGKSADGDAAKSSGSTKSTARNAPGKKSDSKPAEKDAAEHKGVEAKLIKITKEKRWFQVEMVDGGKKAEYTLGEDVEFVGPRGGVSDDEFEDDRFVVGNIVRIEMDAGGKKVVRIHLPYRKRAGDK